MANYNEHKCLACGQTYEYCRRCAIAPVIYKAEGFCSENCHSIFNILSKYSCKLITADEAFAGLAIYNLDEIKLTEGIMARIESLKYEVKISEEASALADETIPDEKQ